MSFKRRIYNIVRAQLGHYGRRTRSSILEPHDEQQPEGGNEDNPRPKEATGSSRSRPLERAYSLLELPYGSGPEEIRAAHKKLLRRFHPDRFARDDDVLLDATRLSQELTAARDLLLDAWKKNSIR